MRMHLVHYLTIALLLSLSGKLSRAQNPWNIAPVDTRAVVVVGDMQSFSTKIDRVAEEMKLLQPEVLENAKRASNIRSGLNENGPLLWLYGPPSTVDSPIAYLLPATSSTKMLSQLRPRRDGMTKKVTVNGSDFVTQEIEQFVGFARSDQSSLHWLQACHESPRAGDLVFGELNRYLRKQDIGFAISPQGIREGVKATLPFSQGQYVIPSALNVMANTSSPVRGVTASAGGVEIRAELDLIVSVAALVNFRSDVAQWSESMTLKRDRLLRDVPNGDLALLSATSVPDLWKQHLISFIKDPRNGFIHEKREQLINTFDLSALHGVTLYARAIEQEQHWTSTIFLQIQCTNAQQCLAGIHEWIKVFLTDEAFDPRPDIEAVLVDGELTLTMSLRDFRIPATLALRVLNDDTLLLTSGGVNGLKQELQEYDRGGRIRDHVKNSTSYLSLNPADQMIGLVNIDLLSLWLMEVFRDTGAIDTTSISPYMAFPAMFRDAPPISIGNHFDKNFVQTEIAVSKELLPVLGRIVRMISPQFSAQ